MSNRTCSRGPVRPIKRVFNKIAQQITSSQVNTILHTAEKNKTLVRMIINLRLRRRVAATGEEDWDFVIAVRPLAASVVTVQLAQAIDQNEHKFALFRDAGSDHVISVTNEVPFQTEIKADLKSMRKMTELDNITLSTIGTLATGWEVRGYIVLFFKE